MQIVEFFSGTESCSKVAVKRGHSKFSVELEARFNPDLCKNILDVKRSDLPYHIDVLWASVPCTKFSVAGRNCNFINFIPQSTEAALALAYVWKTLELIQEIKKDNPNLIYIIENPMGYLRQFPFMKKLNRNEVWYCKYGDTRAKPTDLFSNMKFETKKCNNNNLNCHHERAPRHSKTGTQGLKNAELRSVIPPALFEDLFSQIEKQDHDLIKLECEVQKSLI